MPRRNHRARPVPDADQLAATVSPLADGLVVIFSSISHAKSPCARCRRRGHWNGRYCPACTGRIILDLRSHALAGR